MHFLDRFLESIKLDDDYDDDEEFLDDEEDDDTEEDEEEEERSKPRKSFFSRFSSRDDDEDDDDDEDVPARAANLSRSAERAESAARTERTAARQPERRGRAEKERTEKAERMFRRQSSARAEREENSRREALRASQKKQQKVTPIRKKSGVPNMEVNVIRPSSMEDTREIADNLMSNCTVVLNLEGLDVDIAQRVIDFTCGVCYSLNGNLQKVSSYIFILTPADVDISGDFQSILNGAFDIPSMASQY